LSKKNKSKRGKFLQKKLINKILLILNEDLTGTGLESNITELGWICKRKQCLSLEFE